MRVSQVIANSGVRLNQPYPSKTIVRDSLADTRRYMVFRDSQLKDTVVDIHPDTSIQSSYFQLHSVFAASTGVPLGYAIDISRGVDTNRCNSLLIEKSGLLVCNDDNEHEGLLLTHTMIQTLDFLKIIRCGDSAVFIGVRDERISFIA